jgi:CBS domain-containing protein
MKDALDEVLTPTTVADLMRRDVVTVSPSTPIRDVVRLFRQRGISGAPVVDETGRSIGMISETDLTWLMERFMENGDHREAADPSASLRQVTAGDVMTADVFGVAPDSSISELAAFFARTGLGRAVVIEKGTLCGIVSVIDLLGAFANESQERPDGTR